MSLIPVDEALALVQAAAHPPAEPARLPIETARGCILASPVVAQITQPPADVSAMDGFAVRESDLSPGRLLRRQGVAFAGTAFADALEPGACVRIFTGAALPSGADRVLMQEDVEIQDDGAIRVPEGPLGRRHVRLAGSDFVEGQVLVEAGLELTPQRLVACAAADCASVAVHRRPRVALIATGDEIVAPGEARGRAGAIPESVSYGAGALAETFGAEIVLRLRAGDDLGALTRAAAHALEAADLVVVTGGASVGEHDHAREMFAPFGLDLIFSKVAVKPGKPVWLGRAQGRIVLGLPGNPTSALVTARLFMAPLIAGLAGREPCSALGWRRIRLERALEACCGRETFYRGRLTSQGHAEPLDDQDSAAQRALAAADLLIRRRPGAGLARAGDVVEVLDL